LFTLTPHILYIWEKLFFDSIGIAANTKKWFISSKIKFYFLKVIKYALAIGIYIANLINFKLLLMR